MTSSSVQGFNPLWFWGVLRRRKWAMLAAFMSALVISIGAYLSAPRMYESSFEIQMLAESFPPELQRLLGPLLGERMKHLGTEMGVLQSYEVIGGALERAGLVSASTQAGDVAERIREIKQNISVGKVENANILTVSVKSADPEVAFRLADKLLEEYEHHSLAKERKADTEARARYEEILDATRREIEKYEASLEKVKELKKTEEEAEKFRKEAEECQKQIADELERLTKLRDELMVEYTSEWPLIQEVQTTIEGIQRVIACATQDELDQITDEELQKWVALRQKAISLSSSYEKKRKEANALRANLTGDESGKQALTFFESQLDSRRERERVLMKAISDLDIKMGKHSVKFAVLKRPHQPSKPISPDFLKHLMLGFLIGILLAASTAYFLEAIDPALQTPEQVQLYTRLEVLGSLPPMSPLARPAEQVHECPRLVFSPETADPVSADSYRMLKTAVQAFMGEERNMTLLCTSALPREGKSTVSINLGAAFAEAGQNTVVVDCNLRHPVLGHLLEGSHHPGVAEIVEKEMNWQDVRKPCRLERLWIIPAGSPANTSSVLLESQRFGVLMAELRANHDVVILDSPPTLLLTDALILCSRVQHALLVYSAGETNKLSFFRAITTLQKTKSTFISVVMNNKQPTTSSRKAYSYYTSKKGS